MKSTFDEYQNYLAELDAEKKMKSASAQDDFKSLPKRPSLPWSHDVLAESRKNVRADASPILNDFTCWPKKELNNGKKIILSERAKKAREEIFRVLGINR